MKKFKSLILTLPALSLLVLGGLSASAYAEATSSSTPARTNSGSTGSGSSTSGDSTSGGTSSTTKPPVVCPPNTHPASGLPCFIKPDPKAVDDSQKLSQVAGAQILTTLKKDHKEHTATERQQYCENNKTKIETRLKKIQDNAAAYLARVDKAYASALTYQKDHNVQVTNWDQLVATANDAQTKAAASVAALQALDPNIDCTSATAAQQLATFEAAAKQARADLIVYKNSVIKIFAALKAVTNNGGTQ